MTTQGYVLIDVRSDKDKAKAGLPQLPSNAKNKLVSVPYAAISSSAFSSLQPLQLITLWCVRALSGWKTFRAS